MAEPVDVLYRVKRGLAGYISYLAACEMNEAFSEYVLYEPMLRILSARGYTTECEYPCPGQPTRTGSGDKKKIDFSSSGHSLRMAIEVKWARSKRPGIAGDLAKLRLFKNHVAGSWCFLCVFGRKSHVARLALRDGSKRGESP